MKYYGVKKRIKQENTLYSKQKRYMHFLSCIPGKNQKMLKIHYKSAYNQEKIYDTQLRFNNGISSNPLGKNEQCQFYGFVTLDIIRREDIPKLQDGIKQLLLYNRSSKFLNFYNTSIEDVIEKIEKMDSSLAVNYEGIECGFFDFEGSKYAKDISYFSLRLRNVNTSYIGVEFEVTLSKEAEDRINSIICEDYHDLRGYPLKYSSVKNKGRIIGHKLRELYTVVHYNDAQLKADKIYEFLNCVEWMFYDGLVGKLPVLLHSNNVIPPRIEIYGTNINYQDYGSYREFWDSIGIAEPMAQFIDDNHRLFFASRLSGRYEQYSYYSRMIWIYNSEDYNQEFGTIEGDIHDLLKEYGIDFFRLHILKILSKIAGDAIVEYKIKLDRIGLNKNKYGQLLKLNYKFEKRIDIYRRYVKDEPWNKSIKRISGLFRYTDAIITDLMMNEKVWDHFCYEEDALLQYINTQEDIELLLGDFRRKTNILQHLSDYRDNHKTRLTSFVTLVVAILTLVATVFPDNFAKIFGGLLKFISAIWDTFR